MLLNFCSEVLLLKGSGSSPNSATSCSGSVKTREPVRDISYPNYNSMRKKRERERDYVNWIEMVAYWEVIGLYLQWHWCLVTVSEGCVIISWHETKQGSVNWYLQPISCLCWCLVKVEVDQTWPSQLSWTTSGHCILIILTYFLEISYIYTMYFYNDYLPFPHSRLTQTAPPHTTLSQLYVLFFVLF